jgi:hypothetical protein
MPASDGSGPVLLSIHNGVAEMVLNRPEQDERDEPRDGA